MSQHSLGRRNIASAAQGQPLAQLAAALKDSDAAVRRQAARALGVIGSQR